MDRPRPFWLPDTQGFLAIAIITLIAVIIVILMMKPITIDDKISGMLTMLIGVLTACLKDVYAYFFGSSKGSTTKDDTLNKIATVAPEALVPISPGMRPLQMLAVAIVGTMLLLSPAFAAGKTPVPAPRPANPFQTFLDSVNRRTAAINAFTLEDAQAAIAMAVNDPVGLACYTAIATKLQAGSTGTLIPKSLGLLQLIESARLAKLRIAAVQTGTDPIVVGCAGLILDANTTLLMLTGQGMIGAAAF